MNLPTSFTEFEERRSPVAFLDIELIPFNCVVEINFHDKLRIVTAAPLLFTLFVTVLYVLQYCLIRRGSETDQVKNEKVGELKSTCIYIVLLVLYSVFPILSAFIFQTFLYDTRLNDGTAFLKADYSIEHADPSQQSMEAYAIGMSLLYVLLRSPGPSTFALRYKQDLHLDIPPSIPSL